MRQLNYEDTKKAVLLSVLGDDHRVPMVMGERGCGKTSLAFDIAEELNANIVIIDANVLKEGEITGLPSVVKQRDPETKKIRQVCSYATHVKLQLCQDLYEENPKKTTILFIDECNRCDSIVKREIMNLILNREINGFELPDNVKVIAACNPSSDFEVYRDTEYQVEDMDEAQKDRFRWICMRSELNTWLTWAMKENEDGETNIDYQIVEYLSDREEFLNNINTSKEDIKTSPRSWEFVSNTYRTFLKKKKKYKLKDNDFLNCIIGDVGINVATDFITFLEDNKNPLVKPEEIFEGKEKSINKTLEKRIMNESILRKNVFIRNCLRYIKREFEQEEASRVFFTDKVKTNGKTVNKFSKEFTAKENLFIELLTKTINNSDLMFSILVDLKESKDSLDQAYLKHILNLKNIEILNAFTKLNQAF